MQFPINGDDIRRLIQNHYRGAKDKLYEIIQNSNENSNITSIALILINHGSSDGTFGPLNDFSLSSSY